MHVAPLPPEVDELLRQLGAPLRLVAHLTLVHDVACRLTARLDAARPTLAYDRMAVRLGAALHDIGKIAHREELTQPGHAHEMAGEALLRAHGYPDALARFARTHRRWADELTPQPEDLVMAPADTWWRGKCDNRLEAAVCRWVATQTLTAEWEAFATVDDLGADLTAEADARLAWQQQFPA